MKGESTTVAGVLDSSQHTIASHKRCINMLEQLVLDGGKRVVDDELFPLMKRFLILKKGTHADRVVKFISEYASQSKAIVEDKPLSLYMIKYLIPFSRISRGTKEEKVSKSIRFRATQIIGFILNNIDIDIE